MPALLSHVKEEKAAQAKEEQLFGLRERLIALWSLWASNAVALRGQLRRIVLTIDEDRVIVTVISPFAARGRFGN